MAPRGDDDSGDDLPPRDVVRQFPWAVKWAKGGSVSRAKHVVAIPDPDAPPLPPVADPESVANALAEIRAKEALHRANRSYTDFSVAPRASGGNLRGTGQLQDYLDGMFRGRDADRFCRRYHLQLSMSFSIIEYSESDSRVLANAWCHRMQWLMDIYRKHYPESYIFAEIVMDVYVESDEFAAKAATWGAALQTQVARVRAVAPKHPMGV